MITLEPIEHKYINDQKPNMVYKSVTTVLGEYKEPFDTEYHAQRVADRRGTTKEAIIAEWEETNKQANIYGTEVHAILERLLLAPNNLYSPRDDFERTIIRAFKNVIEEEGLGILGNKGTKPEYIMSLELSENIGIAGTSDIIEDLNKNNFNVWDFKTNKRFNYDNQYDNYLHFPLNHLCECQYNDYAIQISTYGLMYERETGKKFNRGGLLYYDKICEMFKLIPVPYMKKEAEQMIEHYKMKNNL